MQLTTAVFWSANWQAQVGLDPRLGISLAGMSKAEMELVDSLTRPQTEVEFKLRARALGVTQTRVDKILALLGKAKLLDLTPSTELDHQASHRIFGAPATRKRFSVHIAKADYLGVEIALALARAGVGQITSADNSAVTSRDHPALRGYGLGADRASALKTALRREVTAIRFAPKIEGADLVVVTGSYTTDPVLVGQFLARSLPVYQAWVEEIDVFAGPLSLPHASPCGTCLALHRQDVDANWAILCQQACAAPALLPEANGALLAGALAARAILAFLERGEIASIWRIGPGASAPQALELAAHPRCGCAELGQDS